MLRTFVWVLAVGPILATAGCSDPVPASVAVGLTVNLSQTPTCALQSGLPTSIGNPPPNANVGPGTRVYSGEGGVTASCRVHDSGGGTFTVTGSMQSVSANLSFNVDGSAMGQTGKATISIGTAAIGGTVTSPPDSPCNITVINTTSGLAISPGKIWASYDCQKLAEFPSKLCIAHGEFIFENCNQ